MENKIGAFQNNELDQPLNAKPLSRLPPFPTTDTSAKQQLTIEQLHFFF